MISSAEEARLRQEAVAWVIRLQGQGLLPDERRAFDDWHAQSPAHAQMFHRVSALWDDPDLRAAAVHTAETASSKLSGFRLFAIRRAVFSATALAASVILLIMAALYFDVATRWQADYRTAVGERRTIELPDHSLMTLNTQSAVAVAFDGTARHIRLLKGEALFHVQHDADRPFVVATAQSATRAVGTAFVVRAEAGRDQVTVLEGIVEVGAGAGPHARVSAGLQIETEAGRVGRPYAVDVSTASAWVRGRLVVDDVPLAQVLNEVRRYYPGTITLWNPRAGEIHVTGTYDMDNPSSVLALLVKTVPVHMLSVSDRLAILF
ncbi:FecR family protein [Nitrospira lenta]|nr:FecR family protein [Nitrospira lenta]